MSPPKVAAVILNWNGLSDTISCIESLVLTDYPFLEIIVVDNGSEEAPSQLLHQFPQIHLIINNQNLGFATGNNIGFKYASAIGAKYVWILNNDTVVDKIVYPNLFIA